MSESNPRRKKRFGPTRSELLDKAAARGHSNNNLWYLYIPRLKKDLIFASDAEYEHACWVEGDENVLSCEYNPPKIVVAVGSEVLATQFDAHVVLREGRPQLREVKESEEGLSVREIHQREAQIVAAKQAGFDYLRLSRVHLDQHRLLIQNWKRGLAAMGACRAHVLGTYERDIQAAAGESATPLGSLFARFDPILEPLYLAAVFRSIQSGVLRSDLDTAPLSKASRVWLRADRNRA